MNSKNSKLQILFFKNDGCAQCYTEKPIMKHLSEKYRDQLKIETIDVNSDPLAALKGNMLTAPSVVVIKNHQTVEKISHFMTEDQLETVIQYYLKEGI